MTKYMAVIEYDGTAYHGWQLQKDLPTVQGSVEKALKSILSAPVRVHGAGRTDAGVHAIGQVAHFSAEWAHSPSDLLRACNALLPEDISFRFLRAVPEDFHARHSAKSKTYVYVILNRPLRCPLQRFYAWHLPQPLDINSMVEATQHLIGMHDFATFGSPTDGTPSTVRHILSAEWDAGKEGVLRFTIRGTGFLRYMVRSIIGTLVLVGRGKIDPTEFQEILSSCQRSKSGPRAPAHGLCLTSVEYGGKYNSYCDPGFNDNGSSFSPGECVLF